jgi:hypothetical protein
MSVSSARPQAGLTPSPRSESPESPYRRSVRPAETLRSGPRTEGVRVCRPRSATENNNTPVIQRNGSGVTPLGRGVCAPPPLGVAIERKHEASSLSAEADLLAPFHRTWNVGRP